MPGASTHSHRHVRLPGDLCRPAHSAVSASRAWSPGGRPIPHRLGRLVDFGFASCPLFRNNDRIGATYEQPASILAYWAAPSLPDAVGARNGSQRVQTSPDLARRSQTLLADQRLPVRLCPTVTDTPEFPDTEEVTGSNPVRPTLFESLSPPWEPNGEPTSRQKQSKTGLSDRQDVLQ